MNEPTVTSVRQALIAQSRHLLDRRHEHFTTMHHTPVDTALRHAAHDAYEGLVIAGVHDYLLAAILRKADSTVPVFAQWIAELVAEVMANGGDVLDGANDDLDPDTAQPASSHTPEPQGTPHAA